MCGIVGYVGSKEATPVLLEGLRRLEYRGYDSAGIAVMRDGQMRVAKTKGKLQNLADKLATLQMPGNIGIGHTRWATHGEPSDENSHPHTDEVLDFAVVHNGIIENYEKLKAWLQEQGYQFSSETDTEVIAHLLHKLYDGDMLQTITQAVHMLSGSFALGILTKHHPDTLYCVRRDSPLVIGLGQGEQFIASDIPALLAHTQEVCLLEDDEIGILTRDGVQLYDLWGGARAMKTMHVDWDVKAAEKAGYAHYMLKEMLEQPEALEQTLRACVDVEQLAIRQEMMPWTGEQVRAMPRIAIVACGTAYHAGMVGRMMIEQLSGIPVEVSIASEYRYEPEVDTDVQLMLCISQSGETADTLAAMRRGKQRGMRVVAISNVLGSTLAREADEVLFTRAGPEIAVASTKAYSTQLMMLSMLAIDLGVKRGKVDKAREKALLSAMVNIPGQARQVLDGQERVQRFASRNFDVRHVFYIGRGMDWALAMEGSLKLKEVSYIFSEAYAAGELKHGTIALIEPGTLVIALLTQPALLEKAKSNMREVAARGASVLALCQEGTEISDDVKAWTLPRTEDVLAPILAVLPLQLLAYYMAVARGCDVDQPRNLAKSVTVE